MASEPEEVVLRFELEPDDVNPDGSLWLVCLRSVRDQWNALVAAHAVPEGVGDAVEEAAEEEFQRDLVAQSAVWEADGEHPTDRVDVTPGDAAGWADLVDGDVWAELVKQAYLLSSPESWEWAVIRLRGSALLQVEMAVCREYRIPYSAFQGWEPDDRALAIAQLVEERACCPGCGVPRRAMKNIDAAVLEVDGCLWCEQLGNARREATVMEHPRVRILRGF